jgi:hypothetical protein
VTGMARAVTGVPTTRRERDLLVLNMAVDRMIPERNHWRGMCVCRRCGASIERTSRYTHYRWHASLVEQAARVSTMYQICLALWGKSK